MTNHIHASFYIPVYQAKQTYIMKAKTPENKQFALPSVGCTSFIPIRWIGG